MSSQNSVNQYVMIHDEKRCIGCQACTVACKTVNLIPEGYSRLQVQIREPETALNPNKHFQFYRISCQHCKDAPCVSVCPTGASYQDEDGIVHVDEKLCIGCNYCISACPYHVRYLDPVTHVADKCDFCHESRLAEGLEPACVTVCPTDALVFGRKDAPEIQTLLKEKNVYVHQVANVGEPSLYRLKEQHKGDKA